MRRLRLIGITNHYPPVAHGGYGEICADVMSGLASRGHEVTMLTCAEAEDAPAELEGVRIVRRLDRVLAPWRRPLRGLRAAAHDGRIMRDALASGADAVIAWHCRGVVKTSLRMAHEAGVPVLYQLHDRWVLYERPGSLYVPWARLDRMGARVPRELVGRALAGRVELRAPRVERDGVACFVSEWLEREHTRRGWRPRQREIVRCGVDVASFARPEPPAAPPRRLLFAGRVERRKGLDVAVRALASHPDLTLTVAGPPDEPDYGERVRGLARELGVAERVDWIGEVPRERVRALLAEHDVLVFPSIGDEAYALGLLEALAAGILVVTSALGGPREYLGHDVNSLLFEPGDAAGLAAALARLRDEAGLAARLLEGARRTADEVSLDAVLDQLESLLERSARAA